MGLGHSPSIVTSGLALAFDAGNAKSYPGTGTTWTDLSGNGLTGAINNAPVFSNSAGGNFTFNGTSNTISFTRKRFTAGLTYAAWIKTTSAKNTATYTTTTANPIIGDTNGGVWNGFGVHNGKLRYCYYTRAGNAVITSDSTASVNTGNWVHAVVTHSYTETAKLYINGVLDSTFNVATTGATDPWAQYLAADRIGTGYGSADFFNGSIAKVMLYSADLTADQVLQNFNALRGRFGL